MDASNWKKYKTQAKLTKILGGSFWFVYLQVPEETDVQTWFEWGSSAHELCISQDVQPCVPSSITGGFSRGANLAVVWVGINVHGVVVWYSWPKSQVRN